MLRAEDTPGPVLISNALAEGSCLVIAMNALAVALEPAVIDAAESVVIHEEDTAPGPVGSSAPGRSVWQTDCVALRVRLPVSWVSRAPGAIAIVTNTQW
jgi:hypothetical protein